MTTFAYDAASGEAASVTMGEGSVFPRSYSSHTVSNTSFFEVADATYPDHHSESFTREANGRTHTGRLIFLR